MPASILNFVGFRSVFNLYFKLFASRFQKTQTSCETKVTQYLVSAVVGTKTLSSFFIVCILLLVATTSFHTHLDINQHTSTQYKKVGVNRYKAQSVFWLHFKNNTTKWTSPHSYSSFLQLYASLCLSYASLLNFYFDKWKLTTT